jgi:hypothetical protein
VHLTSEDAMCLGPRLAEAGCTSFVQSTSWADQLELIGDDDRLVGFAGALPLRLLAERTGLRAGLSRAMARRRFNPSYDRGQVLIDMALTES